MTESRAVIIRIGVGRSRKEGLLGPKAITGEVMDMFTVLMVGMVSWVYTHAKIHLIVHFKDV